MFQRQLFYYIVNNRNNHKIAHKISTIHNNNQNLSSGAANNLETKPETIESSQ